MDNEYELRYLPLFYEDMYEKVTYIRDKLLNPEAADDLINAVKKAIMERLPNCESFEPYHSVKEREYPYYRIYVKNFTVYYVVIHMDDSKIMEVDFYITDKMRQNYLIIHENSVKSWWINSIGRRVIWIKYGPKCIMQQRLYLVELQFQSMLQPEKYRRLFAQNQERYMLVCALIHVRHLVYVLREVQYSI